MKRMWKTVVGFSVRLENEHVNNVGKFRAVKLVPLPFRDSEGEEL